jgi:hypothetical protein
MMADIKHVSDSDSFSDEETARRRDEVIRRMANTPPQPRVKRLPARRRKEAGPTASDRKAPKRGDRTGG